MKPSDIAHHRLRNQRITAHAAYALPPFDEYRLGCRGRSAVLDAAHAVQVCLAGNGPLQTLL